MGSSWWISRLQEKQMQERDLITTAAFYYIHLSRHVCMFNICFGGVALKVSNEIIIKHTETYTHNEKNEPNKFSLCNYNDMSANIIATKYKF